MKTAAVMAITAGVIAVIGGTGAHATVALIDFENTPNLAAGPSIYVAVPGPQTIVTAPATFSGGVVLGDATFFPAISFATAPNVYGTADFGNGLATDLTIDINAAFATTEVSFALFNGETFNVSYTVNAFDGAALVATATLNNIVPNFNSGFGLVDLIAANITRVTIAPTTPTSIWDFLIDTVAFNQSITAAVPNLPPPPTVTPPPVPPVQGHRHGHGKKGETELVEVDFGDDVNDIRGQALLIAPTVDPSVPEPTTWALLLAGVAGLGLLRNRKTS